MATTSPPEKHYSVDPVYSAEVRVDGPSYSTMDFVNSVERKLQYFTEDQFEGAFLRSFVVDEFLAFHPGYKKRGEGIDGVLVQVSACVHSSPTSKNAFAFGYGRDNFPCAVLMQYVLRPTAPDAALVVLKIIIASVYPVKGPSTAKNENNKRTRADDDKDA